MAIDPIVGSSKLEVKPDGPVQEYVEPPTVLDVKVNGKPTQTGPVFPTGVGVAGMGLTVTVTVFALVHPPLVPVTE